MKNKKIRRFLIAGLLIWLPIVVTYIVIRFLVDILDRSLTLVPSAYQPEALLGFAVPGFGVIISLMLLLLTGLIATNFFGRRLIIVAEAILARIPLARTIYKAVKQILETLLSTNNQAFRKVLLIEYPCKGLWSIVFQTGSADDEINRSIGKDMVTIYLPTTPNPTSGFLLMVPRKDIVELDMNVNEALKMIISLGVVQPVNGKSDANTSEKML